MLRLMRDNVIAFENPNNSAIEIRHPPKVLEQMQKLSDFIKDLPLSKADNDKLVHMMAEQVCAAERNAFFQGVSWAISYCGEMSLRNFFISSPQPPKSTQSRLPIGMENASIK